MTCTHARTGTDDYSSLVCQRLPAPAAAARGGSRPGGRRAATRRRAPKGVANAMPSGGARAARGSRASVGGHTQSAPSAAAHPSVSHPSLSHLFGPSGPAVLSPPLPVGKKTREPRRADDGLASRPRPCRRRLARPPRIRGLSFCARRGRHGHLERRHSQRHRLNAAVGMHCSCTAPARHSQRHRLYTLF